MENYRKSLEENIFSCMEMSKQSWHEVISMPVLKFTNYLKWKEKLEKEKKEKLEEQISDQQ